MKKDILKRMRGWINRQRKYYICFCTVALFVTASIYCHNVVNYNVLGVLVTYFTATLKKDVICRAALLVNVREGLQILVKAWCYVRRSDFRKIIIFSNAAYILGLLMLYLSASNRIPNTNFGLYMLVSILMAVGKAGGVSFLKTYLLDELIAGHEDISDINYNRVWWRRNIWVLLPAFLLVFPTALAFAKTWSTNFLISMGMIGAASFFSLCGCCLSHRRHHTNTKTESTKRHRKYPDTPDEYDLKNDHQTQEQVHVAKLPLRMIPMWSSFIVLGLVISTANTFFSMQDDNMDAYVTTSNFLLAKDILQEVVAYLCKFLVSSRISKSQQNLALKMGICLGMMFSVLCPSFAWQVEVQRLKIVHERELLGMSMSDWWLAPQFCLWGLMEGLAIGGLDEFFNYHNVSKSMEDYGSEVFNKIPIAIGSLLSVVCVLACKGWFGNTLNESRLDNYLWMITVVAWINLCWFFFVSTFYSTKEKVADEGV